MVGVDWPSNCATSVELIYWRKWWGPRNRVMWNFPSDKCYIPIDEDVCDIIIEALEYFDSKETWEDEDASPIWHYEESNIHEQIQNDILALNALKVFIEEHGDDVVECHFYDSY